MVLKKVDGHSELLEDFLSDVVLYGVGVVTELKLMRWTAAQRMAPRVWKLVQDVSEDVMKAADEDEHEYKLYVGKCADTYSFLFWDRGEGKEGEKGADEPWWKPIEELAEPKVRGRSKSSLSDDELKPLSTHLIEILTEAGGALVKKDDLIKQTRTPSSPKSHGNSVTRMLEKLERGGLVENPEYGFWKISD